jgi:small subunit ribosomal protein S20
MANHPSALKRQRQDKKRRLRNKSYRSTINTSVKKIFSSVDEKDIDGAQQYYKQAIAHLDSAVNKGILHRKTASRRISRLTKRVNAVTS